MGTGSQQKIVQAKRFVNAKPGIMIANRNDPFPRRLLFTMLAVLNVIAIRDEYIENGSLGWLNLTCFLLALIVIYCMSRPNPFHKRE